MQLPTNFHCWTKLVSECLESLEFNSILIAFKVWLGLKNFIAKIEYRSLLTNLWFVHCLSNVFINLVYICKTIIHLFVSNYCSSLLNCVVWRWQCRLMWNISCRSERVDQVEQFRFRNCGPHFWPPMDVDFYCCLHPIWSLSTYTNHILSRVFAMTTANFLCVFFARLLCTHTRAGTLLVASDVFVRAQSDCIDFNNG